MQGDVLQNSKAIENWAAKLQDIRHFSSAEDSSPSNQFNRHAQLRLANTCQTYEKKSVTKKNKFRLEFNLHCSCHFIRLKFLKATQQKK